MALDMSTLYVVATLVAALLGVMLLHFGRQEKIPALRWWGVAYLLGASSVAAWSLEGPHLGPVISPVFNALGFVACGMVWSAARVFHGRQPSWPATVFGAIAWLGAVTLLGPDAEAVRLTIGAAIVAIYGALTAFELWSERRKSLRRRWPALSVPVLHGTVLMLPVLAGDILLPHEARLDTSIWSMIFAVELVLYAVGTVFIIFTLVSERTVSIHKTAASLDPLTGLFNRRGFSEATARMIEREAKGSRSVSVLLFDIDRFKSINDRFGHPAGDEMIKLFSVVLKHSLRATDLSGRIGGEEFAAVLPCSIEDAQIAAERVRATFAASGIVVDDSPIDTTVSIGIAAGNPGTELDVLLAAADTALYQAKRNGRNRIEVSEDRPIAIAGPRSAVAMRSRRRKLRFPMIGHARI